MADLFDFDPRPRPGDLITADYINQILDALEALDQRVAALEAATGTVTITGLSGSVRIGGELTVLGSNFEVPPRFNSVSLDDIEVKSFNPGCDDSHLVFNIPEVPGAPREVKLTVSNRNGTASWRFTVLPAIQVVTGEVVLTELADDHGVIAVGKTYTFRFDLASQTNVAEDYTLAAQYSAAVGAKVSAWQDATTFVNDAGAKIDSIRVKPGSPAEVGIRVTVPDGAESVSLALQVNSVHSPADPQLNRTSNTILLAVDQEVETSDPRVSFDALEVVGDGALITDAAMGEVIEVNPGGEAFVRITAEFQVRGDYEYSASVIPEAPGIWEAAVAAPTPPASTEEAGGEQDLVVSLAFPGGSDPAPSRMLEIRVARTKDDTAGQFASWRRVPVRSS